jgi:outer membrane biosynthesis protein TonB
VSDNAPNTPPAHDDKGGAATKWVVGAVAAIVLVGGGLFVYNAATSTRDETPAYDEADTAYNEYGDGAYGAAPLPEDDAPLAELDEADGPAPEADTVRAPTPPRAEASASDVPEMTIGVTPDSTIDESLVAANDDDIVVLAPRQPIWVRTPSPRRLSALYPERALERGREGEARLQCMIGDGGVLDCDRLSETSTTFGYAALRVARAFRHAETLADGSSAIGTPVNLRVVFRIDDDPRRM